MRIDQINRFLYRDIKPGNEFDTYFPSSSCKATSLGEGDTFFTMDLIKDWSYKFMDQTERLSKKLERSSKKKTIESIYDFLYHHIQYSADGWEQNVTSPACTWAKRDKGIDCKSYTVFASTILLNLGIKHYLRQVVLKSNPDQWSHVYVVVPIGVKTYVIDATKSVNQEVEYIKKHDILMNPSMPHYGLNSPGVRSSVPTNQAEIAVQNFLRVTDILKDQIGISPSVIEKIKLTAKSYLDKGIDPMVILSEGAITIGNKEFVLQSGLGLPIGLGFWKQIASVAATELVKKGIGGSRGLSLPIVPVAASKAFTWAKAGKIAGAVGKIAEPFTKLFSGFFKQGASEAQYSEWVDKLEKVALASINKEHQNDLNPSKMLTEMSKMVGYTITLYEGHLFGCRRTCARIQPGRDATDLVAQKLEQYAQSFASRYIIDSEQRQITFSPDYGARYGLGPFSGNHNGYYTEYVLTPISGDSDGFTSDDFNSLFATVTDVVKKADKAESQSDIEKAISQITNLIDLIRNKPAGSSTELKDKNLQIQALEETQRELLQKQKTARDGNNTGLGLGTVGWLALAVGSLVALRAAKII